MLHHVSVGVRDVGRAAQFYDAALGALTIREVTCPRARDERSGELTAGDETDHKGSEAQSIMDVKRKDRQRDANDEECNEHNAHDGQQRQLRLRNAPLQHDNVRHVVPQFFLVLRPAEGLIATPRPALFD